MAMLKISVLLGAAIAISCAAKPDAEYAAGFENCYQVTSTCKEYLACWQKNQRDHHRPVTGSCKGGSDAGSDSNAR